MKTLLREVSGTDLPVLLQGEPGTGKRLAARTVHALSARRPHPFVEVRCSALHEQEAGHCLFGAQWDGRGCPDRPCGGALYEAALGTLFLEGVETLLRPVQDGLLDYLRRQRDADLSGTPGPRADARLVAGTQVELEAMARAGSFSSELYYRLSVAAVKLPPLRRHRQDVPWLALYFAHQCAARMGLTAPALGREAMAVLLRHDWPGNVWQLKRLLEQAVVLSGEDEISAPQLERLLQAR